jgi:hypothetical protein
MAVTSNVEMDVTLKIVEEMQNKLSTLLRLCSDKFVYQNGEKIKEKLDSIRYYAFAKRELIKILLEEEKEEE